MILSMATNQRWDWENFNANKRGETPTTCSCLSRKQMIKPNHCKWNSRHRLCWRRSWLLQTSQPMETLIYGYEPFNTRHTIHMARNHSRAQEEETGIPNEAVLQYHRQFVFILFFKLQLMAKVGVILKILDECRISVWSVHGKEIPEIPTNM